MSEERGAGAEGSRVRSTGFLTVAEVARQLRVSNMTVYRLVKGGELPAVKVGRGYRVRETDLLKYLQDRYMDAG